MAGPWEKYAAQADPSGPWDKYKDQPASGRQQPDVRFENSPAGRMLNDPNIWQKTKDYATDAVNSAATGIVKGVDALGGMAGFAGQTYDYATNSLTELGLRGAEKFGLLPKGKTADQFMADAHKMGDIFKTPAEKEGVVNYIAGVPFPTGKGVDDAMQDATGEFYKSKTGLGKFTGGVAELVPSTLLMPGNAISNIGKYALVPGGAGETADIAAKGTRFEPYAKPVAQTVTGLGMGFIGGPSTYERMAGGAARGVTDGQYQVAQALMRQAEQRGVKLTVDEAIQSATNGATQLGNLRRIAESLPEGNAVLGPAMAQRPAQVEAAGRATLDRIGGRTATPSFQGAHLQEGAQAGIDATRQKINKLAQPYYDQLPNQRMDPADFAALQQNPSFAGALADIRGNPELNRPLANLPDDNLALANEITKRLDRNATSARQTVMNPGGDNRLAALRGEARTATDEAGAAASPDWRDARQIVAQGREQVLNPLEAGPMGKIAATSDPQAQAAALMPKSPLPGSEQETARAVQMLMGQAPDATRGVVRGGIEQTFNRTAAGLDTQARPDQFGGAKFAAAIKGDPQRYQNIVEAITAVGGKPAAQDMQELVGVLQSTGWRNRPGSLTAFNQEALRDMSRGGAQEAVQTAMGPMAKAKDVVARVRLGSQSEGLADLLMSGPEGIARVQQLAAQGDGRAQIFLALMAANQQPR